MFCICLCIIIYIHVSVQYSTILLCKGQYTYSVNYRVTCTRITSCYGKCVRTAIYGSKGQYTKLSH